MDFYTRVDKNDLTIKKKKKNDRELNLKWRMARVSSN